MALCKLGCGREADFTPNKCRPCRVEQMRRYSSSAAGRAKRVANDIRKSELIKKQSQDWRRDNPAKVRRQHKRCTRIRQQIRRFTKKLVNEFELARMDKLALRMMGRVA